MTSKKLIYSFTNIFNAFAATLHEEEAKELANNPDVISIIENRNVQLHTTRSWDFLSTFPNKMNNTLKINESIWEKANHGEDMIIANVFGQNLRASQMKAMVQFLKSLKANVIMSLIQHLNVTGARFFYKGFAKEIEAANKTFPKKPILRDMQGHGTHTLSIAAGNVVPISGSMLFKFLGLDNAKIRGGSSRARAVAYKAIWPEVITEEEDERGLGTFGTLIDGLAAIEAAISDGVDIINLSMGLASLEDENHKPMTEPRQYYFKEPLCIASFHAMTNGVLIVASSGNSGPTPSTATNISPWILTVGASTLDREFTCYVSLGNHQKIRATRYIDAPSDDKFYPIITGADARVVGADLTNASYCMDGTLDPTKVKGKYLVCLLESASSEKLLNMKGIAAKAAGGVGVIIANDKNVGLKLLPDTPGAVPSAHINYQDGQAPDVIAPGVSIIGAYTDSPSGMFGKLAAKYFLESGTSQSAPHVAAVAALLKKLYPRWTVSAIKSAIMTTASPLDNNENKIDEDDKVHEASPFAIGAGLIQPNLAMDPGLVYDMDQYDYINFLCSYDSVSTPIKTFTKRHAYKCPKSFNILDFNYPSISVPNFSGSAIVTRRLKNVGPPSTYTARVQPPPGISIVVEPNTLVFSKANQEIKFKLVFSTDNVNHLPPDYQFGSLVWSDGQHNVRSPIAVKPRDKAPALATKTPTKASS
ncbi:Subtilisin-like protease SBT5.4 [Bienertia sinuspersici]